MSGNAVRWFAPELDPAPVPEQFDEPLPEAPVLRPPSLEDIQAIEAAAQHEGLERGHAEGLAQGQAEIRRLTAQIEGILDNFSRPLARLENEVVGALGELAVRIAGSLVGRAYEADPALLAELVGEALDAVGGARREVEVRLHPDDIAALTPLLASMADGTWLVPDLTLSRGDLRVHAEAVRIDGTLEARLRAALETVMRKSGAGL
ncbi:FliH/SctL family protein [Xanthomonas theicola]|uniref:Flagellar assembly protein FliH n=1 Tax=Xanthomonas theicola TaxID=56464 RepID=A0A2S6ZEU7_9XANT|nr:FliH/SctL family protein [Xanthomonas theicola]PPT90679.1 flagellar assembly protein FliH [Xanthomonas theicola]QNH24921.1 flagellar assembly protein FliH [Xanthomonas theicola]